MAYRYYACKSVKKKACRKKVVNKQKIEDRVVLECRKLLTDSNIEKIALAVAAACEADYDSSAIKRIKSVIQEADAAIENLWRALERGQAVDMITERIEKRKREKDDLQGQLAIEMGKQVTFTAPQIKAFLYSLKRGNVNDENNRRGMVNIFLRAIYLYDDRMTLILNGGDRPITIDDILLDEIEEYFEGAVSSHAGCSPLVAAAPPKQHNPNLFPSGNEFGFVAYPDNISVYGKRSPPFLTGTIFVMYFPASGSIPHMPHALLYGPRFFCISYAAGEKTLPFTGNLWYTSHEAYRLPVQYHAYFLTGGLNGFCPAHL